MRTNTMNNIRIFDHTTGTNSAIFVAPIFNGHNEKFHRHRLK